MQRPALTPYRRYLRLLYRQYRKRGVIAAVLTALAFGLAIWELCREPTSIALWGKVLTLLAAVTTVMAAIWSSMKAEIERNYTLGLALAHGYFNNFVRHVLTGPGDKLVVYRPRTLDDLAPSLVNEIRRELTAKGFVLTDIPLPGGDGSARQVTQVAKAGGDGGGNAYLDFPRTLLTLESLIDYRDGEFKSTTGKAFTQEHRATVSEQLIDSFFAELGEMVNVGGHEGRVVIDSSIQDHF